MVPGVGLQTLFNEKVRYFIVRVPVVDLPRPRNAGPLPDLRSYARLTPADGKPPPVEMVRRRTLYLRSPGSSKRHAKRRRGRDGGRLSRRPARVACPPIPRW
jgi:hypothetical protein